MISDQTRRIVATTSARSARFGPDAEPGLLMTEWTPMVKIHTEAPLDDRLAAVPCVAPQRQRSPPAERARLRFSRKAVKQETKKRQERLQ